jgi:hypothetical protein
VNDEPSPDAVRVAAIVLGLTVVVLVAAVVWIMLPAAWQFIVWALLFMCLAFR